MRTKQSIQKRSPRRDPLRPAVTITIPKPLLEKLDQAADAENRTRSNMAVEIIKAHLQK